MAAEGDALKSVVHECTKPRIEYDSCFNKWFRDDFLKGSPSTHESACGDLFGAYQNCLKVRYDHLIGTSCNCRCKYILPVHRK